MCPAPAAMLARAGLILCLVVGSRQLSITEFEVPAAVESGGNAELRCRYDRGGEPEDAFIVKWWWTPAPLSATSAEKSQIYQRIASGHGTPIPHNIEIKDNDTIVLLKTTPSVSGIYECEVSLMSEKVEEVRKNQVLTIFTQGTGPNLTITEMPDGPDEDEEEDVVIECKADDVAPAPDIQLTVDGENYNMTEYAIGPDEHGLYDIIGNATLSRDAADGAEVRCELFYENPTISHQPYYASQVYTSSGALNDTEAPEEATEPHSTPDSLQNPSGDSSQCHVSWTLVFALGLLTQLPALV